MRNELRYGNHLIIDPDFDDLPDAAEMIEGLAHGQFNMQIEPYKKPYKRLWATQCEEWAAYIKQIQATGRDYA